MLFRISIKTLCLLAFVLFAFTARATNYYLSNSGNDANSGTDPSFPWQTLNKLNSFKNLKPGDNVLFKRGDTFYGSITVSNSGSAGNLITYEAYGTGANPVITGFTNVNNWTNLGGNIWESTNAVSTLMTCNMVAIDGVNTPMGRYPNSGYLAFQSHNGKTSITSSELSGTPNWQGGEVVIRSTQWTLERKTITSQSGSTLTYPDLNYEPANGFGFFIQNDPRTLDEPNEWYYNPTTKKISIYNTSQPASVSLASKDTLVTLHGNYLNFNNLSFEGANQFAFYNDWNGINNVSIENCSISFSGIDAIKLAGTSNFTISNSKILNSNNNGINLFYLNPFATINNNEIENTGIFSGMGQNVSNSYSAIFSNDKGTIIQNNKITNSGYNGISTVGDSFIIKNNYIDTFCTVLQDGGGIYTDAQQGINYGRKIINNIVLNGIGSVAGTNDSTYFAANGIYLDDNSANIEVSDNSVANCSNSGLFIHNGYNLNIHDNTFYNSSAQFATQNDPNQYTLRGSFFNNNIFFSKTINQFCGYFASTANDFSLWGTANNNFYAKPINDSLVFKTRINWSNPDFLTLEGWKSYSGLDQNSKKSPKSITDTSDLRFEFNTDSVSKKILLSYNYIDVTGTNYNGSIILAPYSSVILIKNGLIINQPPKADAGKDQSIVLPINSVKLTGSSTDTDGEISYFQWTKISGPSNYNITDTKSPITDVTGLTEGVYLFELKVTDNNGATATDTLTITVNPQKNISPNANAGPRQTIMLPVNSIILTGSATDSNGQITKYLWEKISGPSGFNIENPNSAVTNVTGLTKGTYQFQLTVTDDKGAIASSTVQIVVNPPLNIPPTANAGSNETITLPTNTVSLFGNGTDADGMISSYSWTKIFGPSSGTINNANSDSATINNLSEGVYRFELKVTDDQGAVGKDTVQVTVNAAPNVRPTVNAGANQSITLPTNTVTLSGSGSDSDRTITSFQWTKISGPSGGTINNANSASFIVNNLSEGVYQFELTVTDDRGATGKDTVQITVNKAPNISPTAHAGEDKVITLPTDSVSLSGNGTDADGTISSYSWTKISGPSGGTITNANSASTTVTGLVQGIYQFELKITDNNGATGKDTMQLTVNTALNHPPTANAGVDLVITLPTNTVTLNGSGKDTDGIVAIYFWTKISGPSSFNITNIASPITDVSGLLQGVYEFELQVTDNNGAVGRDTVRLTVNAAANIVPVANAGSNQTITLPMNTLSLAGSGTDVDGTITNYLWIKISGPSTFNIVNAASPVTDVSGLVQGVYLFQLEVTDNNGATGTNIMQVTVNASANIAPVASAGSDQTITLPVNSITLSGSGSDADGTVVSYLWTKLSGPSSGNITNTSLASTSVTGLVQGVYQFQLKVMDNNGATGTDIIQVAVAAANISPIANAGSNQTITLPINSVTLSGSGSDTDGTVVSSLWTKISGPSSGTINNANSASAIVNNLSEGVYRFELKVTDDRGATGKDTVQITVNAAPNMQPTANAGGDKTITLPTNTVSLSGNGTDPDGTISSYSWTKISGPASYNIESSSSTVSIVSGLVQGVYQFELKVTDNEGAFGKDTVQITVNLAPNMAPKANAGSNQTITLPTNTISLNGNGVDSDGTISTYLWTKIAGPAAGTITDASSALTTVKGLKPGNYIFQLTVSDNGGAKGTDSIYVTVYAPKNIAPTANAGGDLTIVLPVNSAYLNGSGNDTDGTITAYQWKQIAGPDSASITTDNKPSTEVKSLVAGTYEFELTVTDNNEETGRDTVSVVVALGRISGQESNSIKIYPNPVKDITTVEIYSENINSRLTLFISDFAGKIVYRKQIISSDYKTTEKINMSTFSKGSYALSVFFDDKDKQVLTIIKQ